ncbi:MAG TPA: MFS transporter [Candidatus Acidoferrales bacterium]|nr:MFS transporter [Candidatus Acidoferrales bacterium]
MKFRHFTGRQWTVLVILMLINFVNYVDRQIIFSLFPSIRAEFGLSYKQLGSFAMAFTVVLAVMSLPLGMLADRVSRRLVISIGVIFWSAATFFSGLATSFRTLLAARALVGVGEAAYTPAGTAVISATFPKEVRARVQGAFDAGMFVGGAVGIALGGIIAQWFGWRAAFFFVGVPGLLLGLSGFKLPEPPGAEPHAKLPLRELARVPAYLMILVSGWFSSFAGYTYVTWGPDFVQEYRGFTPQESGIILGVTALIAGACGILAGATLADHLARKWPWGRAIIVPIGFAIASPFIYGGLHAHTKLSFAVLFGIGTFFLSWYHGPVTATIHDLIPSRGHATALGLYYLFVNLFAMALAPIVIGAIADRIGLVWALHTAIGAQLIGGALFLGVPYFIRRDGLHNPALAKYWETEPAGVVGASEG